MSKEYIAPSLEVIAFEHCDVIITSDANTIYGEVILPDDEIE